MLWLCPSLFLVPVVASIYDWPNVLGDAWLFDQGSTFGYRPSGVSIRGPAPDWALGDGGVPVIRYQGTLLQQGNGETRATSYPGSILMADVRSSFRAQLAFLSSNVTLVKLTLENVGVQPASSRFNITGSGANISTVLHGNGIKFALPKSSMPCFPRSLYSAGQLSFIQSHLLDGHLQPLQWNVTVKDSGHFEAISEDIKVAGGKVLVAFALITHVVGIPSSLPDAYESNEDFNQIISRWEGYLRAVQPSGQMNWAAVKSVMTLIGNWRTVPGGRPPGVLPSYVGYEGGFWSWDTYKQAVGMVHFAPHLAKDQLRLLISARDKATGHIPDKVDRCGVGGGCSGKPPLLAWAVWKVFQETGDRTFLREMYDVIRNFHHFWYEHRDVNGAGLCSWTEGMESGMDDGVRFQPEFAKSISNTSTHVTTLDFWSVDLNSYLYKEKRLLSKMAAVLDRPSEAAGWLEAAEALLVRLRAIFFVENDRAGFFSDVYFNGSALPIKGCEGFAALFCGVATLPQARKVVETLRDPKEFFLNFSLPTVSKNNKFFNAQGYWKGPTWIDQTWFAYAGLRGYESLAKAAGADYAPFAQLASELKQKIFRGNSFVFNDTTPFSEHYDPDTGVAQGIPHFSWTAAHVLMWAMEVVDPWDDAILI